MGRNRGVILQWTFLGAKVSRHYKGHSGVIKKWTLDTGDIAISPFLIPLSLSFALYLL